MKYIKTHDEFNEGFNLKKGLMGAALGGLLGTGIYQSSQIMNKAQKADVEVVSGKKFDQYDVIVNNETFKLNISDDGVITSEWSEEEGSGKNRTTHVYRGATVPKGTTDIWIESKFAEMDGNVFVSTKPLQNGNHIKLSDLDLESGCSTYNIYSLGMFSELNYIIVDNGHVDGEEFTIDGRIGNWACDKLGSHIYSFTFKNFGGGSGGGAGSGGKF